MKVRSWLICLVLVLGCLLVTYRPAAADPWLHNYFQAQAKAKQLNRPLLVYFTGEGWCPYCTTLDQKTFNQPAFLSYAASHMVICKINCQNGKPWGPAAAKFKVNVVPTKIVLSPDGKVICRANGLGKNPSPQGFISWVTSKENQDDAKQASH